MPNNFISVELVQTIIKNLYVLTGVSFLVVLFHLGRLLKLLRYLIVQYEDAERMLQQSFH